VIDAVGVIPARRCAVESPAAVAPLFVTWIVTK
jgi:hypothetical protein